MTRKTIRTPKQQEYRDHLADTIRDYRKSPEGKELARILLDKEKLKYEYIESLGEGRKLDNKTSEKRFKKDNIFVIRNLEKFNLDNNKIAERLFKDYPIFFFYNLKHFKGLNLKIAKDIISWSDSIGNFFTYKFLDVNTDSFDEDAKNYILRCLDMQNAGWDEDWDEDWDDENGNDEIEDNNEAEDNKIEEVKVKDNISVNYSQWNKSKEVEDYFNRDKFEKPFFEIDFDGKKMFLTRLQPIFDGSYDGFVGFIEVNGKYEIRYFIKSGSEQLRRCCPGYCSGSETISKLDEFNPLGISPKTEKKYIQAGFKYTGNFSYERSTMVDFRLGQELEKIYFESVDKKGKYHEYFDPEKKGSMTYPNGGANTEGNSVDFDKYISSRCISMSREIDITDDFSDRFQFDIDKLTVERFKEIYEAENIGIDVNSLELDSQKEYRYYHERFGCRIHVNVCKAQMLGKDVEIFFSYTEKEPDLVWIDNIQYKDQPMNSYGIPAKQINAGWLTKKPVDYRMLCPSPSRNFPGIGFKYKDIRSLYQGHPLIKKYKELAGIE